MADMDVAVKNGYDSVHVESNLNHDEPLEKKPRLDDAKYLLYSSDDEYGPDGNKLSVEEMKQIKIETAKKLEAWSATIKDEDRYAYLDITDACILELDKLSLAKESLIYSIASMLKTCTRRMVIYTFTHPVVPLTFDDGAGTNVYESSMLNDEHLQCLSTKASIVIKQYNDTLTNKQSNSTLQFDSFSRAVYESLNSLYITFKARQNGNGQIRTYQAAINDDFFGNEVHLLLLRDVDADKILAILSVSGAEKILKKMYGENWNPLKPLQEGTEAKYN